MKQFRPTITAPATLEPALPENPQPSADNIPGPEEVLPTHVGEAVVALQNARALAQSVPSVPNGRPGPAKQKALERVRRHEQHVFRLQNGDPVPEVTYAHHLEHNRRAEAERPARLDALRQRASCPVEEIPIVTAQA